MAHTHDVYDMENHFEINGSSRFIKETSETKLVVVQGDHKSEVLTFKMPRYIDGHDMTLCNKIRIHYINLDTKTNNKSADVYEVTDLTLCEECEDVLTFTWTIEAPATKYSGTLSFLVKFECTEGENVLYQWNTAKYVSVNVLAGIDNSEEFVEKYSNVLEEWYNELTKGADSIEELNQQAIAEIELAKEDAKEDIENKASEKMKEIDEYCENIEKIIPIFIKWNGDITDKETITIQNTTFYKVSNLTYTVDELNGCHVVISEFEETYVADKSLFEETEDIIILKASDGRSIFTFGVVVKHDIEGSTKGIYFMDTPMGNTRIFTEKLSEITSNVVDLQDVIDKIIDPDNNPLSESTETTVNFVMETGALDSTGADTESQKQIRSDFISLSSSSGAIYSSVEWNEDLRIIGYDENKVFVKKIYASVGNEFSIPETWAYLRFYTGATDARFTFVYGTPETKAEFKKVYIRDHGYCLKGENISESDSHKLVIQSSGLDGNVYNITEIRAPYSDPKEATLCLTNWGNGVNQMVDISSMAYDPENPTMEIVCQARNGSPLPKFSVRYNDGQGAGRVKKFVVHPDAIPIELTAQGLKVRKNNTFDNNGAEEDYIVVNLVELVECMNSIEERIENYINEALGGEY